MRRKQNTLLAGIAALALVAGTGVSLAQQNQSSQPGTPGTSASPAADTSPSTAGSGAMQHGSSAAGAAAQANSSAASKQTPAAQQKIGQNSSQNGKQQNAGQAGNRSAQNAEQGKMVHGMRHDMSHGMRHAQSRTERNTAFQEHGRDRQTTAQEHRRGERSRLSTAQQREHGQRTQMNTAQQRNDNMHGLQANTSIPMQGGNVNLNDRQRNEIRDQVIDARGAPRVGHVDFDVRVGAVVPRQNLRIVRVPRTLVQIEPRWRGYDYFIYEDQVVVVSPRTMRIVAVLPA